MKIEISQEDYEFLKDLQHELNTQETDGNAQPVFWGVSETQEECRGEYGDFGGEPRIVYDDGNYTLQEAIENVEQALDSETYGFSDEEREKWKNVDKDDAEEVCEYMRDVLGWDNIYHVAYVEKVRRVSEYTGAFLTKRACKQYIERYGYNHNNPHTYAMTAYRNFELERLIKILGNLEFKEE